MKKFLAALIVSVALPAAACHAHDNCLSFGTSGTISYGFRIKVCGCLHWNPCGCAPSCCGTGCGGGGYGAGPWYSYWPLEAHFQVPAPTGFPYWPSPMDSSVLPQQLPAYGYRPGAAPQAAPMMPGTHQQIGYYQQAPSYWYGN
jgi:hypothetical protein